jgi:hypothetical protein
VEGRTEWRGGLGGGEDIRVGVYGCCRPEGTGVDRENRTLGPFLNCAPCLCNNKVNGCNSRAVGAQGEMQEIRLETSRYLDRNEERSQSPRTSEKAIPTERKRPSPFLEM